MHTRPAGLRLAVEPQHREASTGIRGCVRHYLFRHMLDAVAGSFKVLICDPQAAALLNSSLRVHDLMEHSVTLVEDLATPRQPIIGSPALYFFVAGDDAVARVVDDWAARDPYREAHIFALGTTADRYLQQLAQARVAQKVMSFKDMMLEFAAPETLVFHLNMPNAFAQLLSPQPQPTREAVLDMAATRLVSVFHAMDNGVPVIHYQNRSDICHGFAKTFLEKLAKLCFDEPNFKNGADERGNPVLIILDRGFDTVTPLMHHRTYQCLLDDLMPLENNLYEQTLTNRTGADSKRLHSIDEEDLYWCTYRHHFFLQCLEELPAELKKLHAENPSLAQGMEQKVNVAELGSAVRALPEFQEKQTKLSLHIDICTKLMALYREKRLAEVCEVEQDIAAERMPFKTNLENVRRLAKDAAIPENVRLRLLLLFVAASNTSEFTETKKQDLIRESGLTGESRRFENLERVTRRVGRVWRGSPASEQSRRNPSVSAAGAATETDPFLNQAYMIMESVAKNTLSAADYPLMNSSYESRMSNASEGLTQMATAPKKKTLRVGLSLAAMQRGNAANQEGANGGRGSGNGNSLGATDIGGGFQRSKVSGGSLLDLGGSGGTISLTSPQRIVVFILGNVTCSEMGAAYEISKKYGREVFIGGTSMMRPDTFVEELGNLQLGRS